MKAPTKTTCSGLFKARRLWKGDSPLPHLCERRISDVPGNFFVTNPNNEKLQAAGIEVGECGTSGDCKLLGNERTRCKVTAGQLR